MKIHYFLFEAAPLPDSSNFKEAGGAYINCWVRSGSAEQAEPLARDYIKKDGWYVVSLEEHNTPEKDRYRNTPDSLEMYEQAENIGEGYIIYTWPPGPQEGDTIH